MATPDQIRSRGRLSLIVGTLLAALLFGTVIASGAELVTAELDGTANDVTVSQGGSTNFTISLSATGSISEAITSANPSKAKVKTSYSLNAAGALSSGTFSSDFDFYAGATGCSGGGTSNCPVTWSGAPTPYTASATISADAATPIGNYTISLSETAGTTQTVDPGVSGGKLDDDTPTAIRVRVVAPPAPTDTTPPVITETVTGTLGNNDWYTSNVTVSWSVVDGESTISSQNGCGTVNITTDQDATTYTCTATSAGGTASKSVSIKRDATAPTISGSRSPDPNGAGWNNTNVAVSFTCNDSRSGIASCGPNQTLSSNGASQSATGTAVDNAGNSATTTVTGINIDKTGPTLTASAVKGAGSDPYAEDSWTNQDVTVTFTCTDSGGSGVAGGSPSPNSASFTTEGTHSASSTCGDVAGNTATKSFGVKIDKTAPTITASATVTGGGAYVSGTWTNQTVTVGFSCTDSGGSGLDGTCPAAVVVSSSTPLAGQNVSAGVSDKAGNSATSNVIIVKVDKIAPAVSVTGVANGASYMLGSVPTPGCSTSDLLSGVKTSATLEPLTGPGTTHPNGVGSFTASCSGAEDNAGNTGSASVTYSVIYGNLVRFLQPINYTAHDLGSNPDVSTFKAGSTVPAKVQIKLPNGTILQSSSVLWITPQKGQSTTQPVDEALYTEPATSGTSYAWQADDQFYKYNWQTPKTGAGFYWLIGAKLDDGQTYKVYISLR